MRREVKDYGTFPRVEARAERERAPSWWALIFPGQRRRRQQLMRRDPNSGDFGFRV